ncbi:MAG: hypothetical protein E7413_04940 [Ruminococcaceae bacterium]|nr:hypothetical protein [Oscillospiraceae bacterium]
MKCKNYFWIISIVIVMVLTACSSNRLTPPQPVVDETIPVAVDTEEIYEQFLEANTFYYEWLVNTRFVSSEYEHKLLDEMLCTVPVVHETICDADTLKDEVYQRFSPELATRFVEVMNPEDIDGQLYITGSLQALDGWYHEIAEHSFTQVSPTEYLLELKVYYPANQVMESEPIEYSYYTIRCTYDSERWTFMDDADYETTDTSELFFR